MSEWKPIESAPRDRCSRLVYVPINKCIYCVSWVEPYDAIDAEVNPAGWYVFGAGFSRLNSEPTHWMPLPEPPK